ncbi:MAG: DUF6514 family protein [Oscillospiraceae bacterium]
MRTISERKTKAVTEEGKVIFLRYCVFAKPLRSGRREVGESLGIRVEARCDGEKTVKCVDDVTTDIAFALHLQELLANMTVTPTTLLDVIIDAI